MAVDESARLKMTTWSADSDPFTREQMMDTVNSLEERAATFLVDSSTPASATGENERMFHFNTSTENLKFSDGSTWRDVVDQNVVTAWIQAEIASAISAAMPIGVILGYGGSSTAVPEGWKFCNGEYLLQVQYPDLYAVLGTSYGGPSNGAYVEGWFRLPDLRARALVGASGSTSGDYPFSSVANVRTTKSRGNVGGTEKHLLTEAEMPSHSHGPGEGEQFAYLKDDGTPREWYLYNSTTSPTPLRGLKHNVTAETGGDDHHENMMPYGVAPYIIKVGTPTL